MDQQPKPVLYICGKCGRENTLQPGHDGRIQCSDGECRYPVLYKKRPRKIVEYQAR